MTSIQASHRQRCHGYVTTATLRPGQAMAERPEASEAALRALGLCAAHLREALLDRKLLPCGAFQHLPGCAPPGCPDLPAEAPAFVTLDGSAFDNLEVGLNFDV